MLRNFITTVKSRITDPLNINGIDLSMKEPEVSVIDIIPIVPTNRAVLWALVNHSNETIGIYSPYEVESNFLRIVSKDRLYTDGEEIFRVVEV